MKVRFQADADFNQNIVRAVRRRARAIDFQSPTSCLRPCEGQGSVGTLQPRHRIAS
jgi:hypothetical protein